MATILKSLCFSFIILSSFATFFTVADARRFYVGGNGVWAVNPQENYKTWAERNRFQVNDTLYFKYAKGSDSVQQVMKADFDGCNIRNPIMNFDNGEAVVTLNRSGPFYFISGNEDHCKKGQKLIVVVLAIRNHPTHPISPAKPPTSVQPPKSHSPVSPLVPAKSPSMAQPPKSPSPISPISPSKPQPPKSTSPVSPIAPSSSPSKSHPPKSSSPVSPIAPSKPQPPKSSVSHSPVVSPSHAPSTSPASPHHAPTSPPSFSPSPSDTPPSSVNITSPAPAPSHKNSASGMAVTSVMTSVLSLAFTVLMFA